MILTGPQARKIGRLSSLRLDAEIAIHEDHDDGTPREESVGVHIMDEYGLKPLLRIVVRENGWSNPSVKRARAELSQFSRSRS